MPTWLITGCSTGLGRALAAAVLEGITGSLRKELAPLGITAMAVEPGAFRTDFAGARNVAATT
jgi:NAD(P)-dependent dehydrogenase (short-subunit alcohol dehydrogenase family)